MEDKEVVIEKDNVEKKAKTKTALTIVGNVVFYAVIILLFLFSLMNINAGNGKENFPNLFGRGMLSVQTTSMERNGGYEPVEWADYKIKNINAGDLVYVKVYKENKSELNVGDVITFYDSTIEALNTHRIVYISETFVICQGDKIVTMSDSDTYAFDKNDPMSSKNAKLEEQGYTQTVYKSNIKGVVTGVSRNTGKVLDNIRSNWLFYFVIPVAVILLVEVFFVFKNVLDLKNEKNRAALATDKETMMADLEAEKEKMRQELLAEMRAQMAAEVKSSEPADNPEPIDAPTEETSADETSVEEGSEEATAEVTEAPAEEPEAPANEEAPSDADTKEE